MSVQGALVVPGAVIGKQCSIILKLVYDRRAAVFTKFLEAMKRGRGMCGTFKAFNQTYLHILSHRHI